MGRLPAWWPWPLAAGLLLALVLATFGGGDSEDGAGDAFVWPRVALPDARPADEVEALRDRVTAALRPLVAKHGDRIGVIVLGPAEAEVLFEHNADRPFVPASNAKLFASGAAWAALGPEHRFATRLLVKGSITDGTLDGDLIVVGAGDPGLSPRVREGSPSDPAPAFARAIREAGVERVTGDLLLDDGRFDRVLTQPSYDPEQRVFYYQAEVSALVLNDACILVSAQPGPKVGAPAIVGWEPRCAAIRVVSAVKTSAKGKPAAIECRRPAEENVVKVRGTVEIGSAGESGLCTIHDPTLVFGSVLERALADAGVTLEGETRVAPGAGRGDRWREVARVEGDLLTALGEANRTSHNLTADCLLKLTGARCRGEGTFPVGAGVVRDGLIAAGVDPEGFRLVDGSGLSSLNRTTPRQVAGWVRYLRALPGGEGFVETMAAGGQGTLRRRLRATDVRNRVRLKTGTLGDGVRALSGIVMNERWGRLYLAILCRHVDTTTRFGIVERLVRLDR